MANINDLTTIVTKLVADGQTFTQDALAKLNTLLANQADPAVAAGINDAVTSLTSLDQAFTNAEAQLNPPPAGGGTPTP